MSSPGPRAPDSPAPLAFQLEATSGEARAGRCSTPHGTFFTPAFMPVGTHGAVKAMTPAQVERTGAQIVLGNTYHLALRPGEQVVAKLGGLHEFMRWPHPILTDSGGFQVFSLPNVEIDDRGARFKNEVTSEVMDLTPERAIAIQNDLGADIIMAFDECTPHPASESLTAQGVRRTLMWMDRCLAAHGRPDEQALFGIVQGGVYLPLRKACAESLVAMDLPGYAIGGVSVGEGHDLMCEIAEFTALLLPRDKPRYLMGVGLPEDLVAAIGFGIDMFDCVIPTRYARSATVFTSRGRVRLTNRRYRHDRYPIDVSCSCEVCAGGFTRAYLHHLFAANEVLSAILCSIHNVHFYQHLVARARVAVLQNRYEDFQQEFLAEYGRADGGEGPRRGDGPKRDERPRQDRRNERPKRSDGPKRDGRNERPKRSDGPKRDGRDERPRRSDGPRRGKRPKASS